MSFVDTDANWQSVAHPVESKDGHVIGISNVVTDWFARECISASSLYCKDFKNAVLINPDLPNLLWNGSDATYPKGVQMNRDKSGHTAYLNNTFGYKCIARLNLFHSELNVRIKEVAGE